MDGLKVHSAANPKHQEGMCQGLKSYETSLPKVMGFVYVLLNWHSWDFHTSLSAHKNKKPIFLQESWESGVIIYLQGWGLEEIHPSLHDFQ